MSQTPIPPIEGYACYLATVALANGATTSALSDQSISLWDAQPMRDSAPALPRLQLLKSLDELDEETDDDDDDIDLDDEDEEDEDDDLDEDYDEDEEDEDEEDEDDDDDEDEDEDEEEDDVKPLKMVTSSKR
jgi:hypothetical protein